MGPDVEKLDGRCVTGVASRNRDKLDFDTWLNRNRYTPAQPCLMLMWLAWQASRETLGENHV